MAQGWVLAAFEALIEGAVTSATASSQARHSISRPCKRFKAFCNSAGDDQFSVVIVVNRVETQECPTLVFIATTRSKS